MKLGVNYTIKDILHNEQFINTETKITEEVSKIDKITEAEKEQLKTYGEKAEFLRQLAGYIKNRK